MILIRCCYLVSNYNTIHSHVCFYSGQLGPASACLSEFPFNFNFIQTDFFSVFCMILCSIIHSIFVDHKEWPKEVNFKFNVKK